jgi:hypothetical protein
MKRLQEGLSFLIDLGIGDPFPLRGPLNLRPDRATD